MYSRIHKRDALIRIFLSLIGLNGAFCLAYYLSFGDVFYKSSPSSELSYRLLLFNANLLFLIINLFHRSSIAKAYREYAGFVVSYLAVLILFQGYEFSRFFHLVFLFLLFVWISFLKHSNFLHLLGKYVFPNVLEQRVLLIGDEIDISIIRHIDSRPGNYKCEGLLSDTPQTAELEKLYVGKIDELEEFLCRNLIDEVLISTSLLSVEKVGNIIKTARAYHANVSVLPPYFHFLSNQSYRTDEWMGVPVISVYPSKLAIDYNQKLKRALDVAISLIFILGLFPILCLIVAPAIWFGSRGPVFFKQLRKGYKQRPFECYKFRTMKQCDRSEEIVPAKPMDPRTTAVGKALRRRSIDELPQFFNVLAGHMSLVGPRPHMVEHDAVFEKYISRYNVRFVTRPGITGWAQIHGYRGSVEGSPELLKKRVDYDLWYIKNWSLWLDIKIMARTFFKLIKGDQSAY